MGTEPFPGVYRPGRGVVHSPTPSAEVKERIELYIYLPSGPSWSVLERAFSLPGLLTNYHNTDENYFTSLGFRRVVACKEQLHFDTDTHSYRGTR